MVFHTEGKEAMVFHGQKWGLKGLAARMLLAPVLAGGVAAPAAGQGPAAAARSTDPATLLKLGRDALKAGQFDQAQDFARQADKANNGGRWGLWGDTPDSLERDCRSARGKADKARGEQLAKDAKAAFAKCSQIRSPADRLAALDQAYAMCDQAVALSGPADMMDDLFGDRPEKLKKEIDAARLQLRRTVPAADQAKAAPKAGGVTTAQATSKPNAPSGVVPVKAQLPMPTLPPVLPTPAPAVTVADPAAKAQAGKLLADGRALLKANKLADAKAKAAEAQKLQASYAPSDDTPDALTRDVMADGKKQVDELTASATAAAGRGDHARAEQSLKLAKAVAGEVGFPTGPIDAQMAALTASKGGTAVAIAPVVVPVVPTIPSVPDVKEPTGFGSAQAADKSGPVVPSLPAVSNVPPMPVAADAGAPLALPVPSGTPVAPAGPGGKVLLAQAQAELRRNELEAARKLALDARNDVAVKAEADALLRQIDAEGTVRKQKDAAASLKAAADSIGTGKFAEAAGILRVVNADALPPDQRLRHNELMAQALGGADRQTLPPNSSAAPPPAAGLADQVKAMADVEFQKLRSEGMDATGKAAEAWKRGDTEVAVGLLTDFIARVKASGVSPGRQPALTSAAQSKLDNFRMMRHHTDFVLKEGKEKQVTRDRVAGRQLAEQQKRDEIGKKAREVNDLVKAHKYKDAEALALQLKSMDPDDPTLSSLYEMTKRQRRLEQVTANKADKEAMVFGGLLSAEKQGPLVDIDNPIAVNVEAAKKAYLRGTGNENFLKTRTAAERDIDRKLDSALSVEFRNTPLREAVAELRRQVPGGLNISFDDAALGDKQLSTDGVTVTESLKDMSLRNILDIVLKKGRLKFVVENDAVQVTTEERAKGRLVTKVFSVMDLITPIPDYQLYDHQDLNKQLQKVGNLNSMTAMDRMAGPGSGGYTPPGGMGGGTLTTGGNGLPAGAGGATLQTEVANGASNLSNSVGAPTSKAANFAKLKGLVAGMVRPYAWQEQGGAGSLSYYDLSGALVVNQTADIIREVEDLLEALRRLQETSISVEIRVVSLSEAFFERVGVDFSMNVVTKGREQFERSLTTGQFRPEPFINSINDTGRGAVVGFNPAGGGFTPDLNVPIRSTSYPLSTPPFGGYQGTLNPNLNGGLSVGLAFLNDIQVFMFMEAAQGDRRVNVMQAPKITLFNGQTANVFVSDVSFFTLGLQAFNVGGQFVYVPQNIPIPIGQGPAPPGTNLPPGVSVTVQGIVSADRRFVRLNLTPQLSSLTSATVPLFPVTAFVTPVFEGGSQGVPIPFTQFFQQPSVSEIQVQTTVAVPDGGTVVLGGLKTMSEGRTEAGPPVLSNIPYLNRLFRNTGIGRETRHIMIMVTPRIIIQSEEELNQTGLGNQNQLPPPTAGQ